MDVIKNLTPDSLTALLEARESLGETFSDQALAVLRGHRPDSEIDLDALFALAFEVLIKHDRVDDYRAAFAEALLVLPAWFDLTAATDSLGASWPEVEDLLRRVVLDATCRDLVDLHVALAGPWIRAKLI